MNKLIRRIFDEWELKLLGIFLGSILIFAIYTIFIWTPFMLRAEKICLENGYPRKEVTINLKSYCIRTVNQTEYVVPLENLLGE